MPLMSVQRYLGLAREVTHGTPVAANIWLPIDPNPTLAPNLTWLKNDALVGSPVMQIDDIPGVRHDEFDFKGKVFCDTWPALVMGTLGSTDTVTGTASPFSHKIGVTNVASTGSQPPSYTVYDVDNITESGGPAKQMAAGQISELTITFTADGALNYTAKYIGNPFTQVAAPSASFSTTLFIPAWSGTITFGTVASANLVSGQISIKRGTTAIPVVGQQAPFRNWAGPIDVTGNLVFIADASDPTFANSLARDRQVMNLLFTDTSANAFSTNFQMSAVQLKDPKVDGSKAWQEIPVNFTAQSNTTDAVQGGYSPILCTTTNGQSGAF